MQLQSLRNSLFLFACTLLLRCTVCQASKPNIVFILTDDQDLQLGGLKPMEKTRRLIGDKGITFLNAFASTPICCPSRSTILTGLYQHNHGVFNNSLFNCSSDSWQEGPEKRSFVTYLKKQNYTTFYAGKYLNQYGFRRAGGVEHVPPGWDHWYGLVGNSKYYNYTISANGDAEEHGDNPEKDYFTDVISRKANGFFQSYDPSSGPFFMMLATPAAHSPFTPSPKYEHEFKDMKAPRTKNFNISSTPTKHWLLRQTHHLKDYVVDKIDDIFRNRWRTLLSVDDLVENVVINLEKLKVLNDTYIFFSSDHGYHLGQFSLPMDKRQMYETDIRIPLLVRGPNIPAKKISKAVIVTTDFAPTFVELGGGTPVKMDGTSFLPILRQPFRKWQTSFLVEYVGEGFNKPVRGCPDLRQGGVANCFPDCICEDAFNNTYVCVRTVDSMDNSVYCEFHDNEHFVEMYNLNTDPCQLNNLAGLANNSSSLAHEKRLARLLKLMKTKYKYF